jgi:hypothetical protein
MAGMTLDRLLRLLQKHGIWSKQVEFNNQIIVFTRTKTFWFGQRPRLGL